MPLNAVGHVRKMRGGAQSHLLEADDGNFYVVKFRNNPQHRRILINEMIASVVLDYLQLTAPRARVIHVSADFLAAHPAVHLTLGAQRIPVAPGRHFASPFPAHPERLMIYDYLPDALLPQVRNLHEFRGMLVFDKWMGNADGRQSVFFRAMVTDAVARDRRPGFVCSMIDHGFVFNGPHWEFCESPMQGLYARRLVYDAVRALDDFAPWLDLIRHFPEEVIDRAWKAVPGEWFDNDEEELERLLETLLRRRSRLVELIESTRTTRSSPFANWV